MLQDVYPDTAALTVALRTLFRAKLDHTFSCLEILERERNLHTSTYPSEIVRVCLNEASNVALYCKYAKADDGHLSSGHRGGVEYEALVYEKLLAPTCASVPTYFGTYRNESTWLFLEYLEEALRISRASDGDAMQLGASWLGAFHREMERWVETIEPAFLRSHNVQYYQQWAIRTHELTVSLPKERRWIKDVCRQFCELAEDVLAMPQTIVHGEFTTQNVLVANDVIRPVDWESAAIGIGETDLAMFIDGHWPADLVLECKRAYVRSRWSDVEQDHHRRALWLAEIYVQLRWLGDRREWTENEHSNWRFEKLRSVADEAGLI